MAFESFAEKWKRTSPINDQARPTVVTFNLSSKSFASDRFKVKDWLESVEIVSILHKEFVFFV